jgi:hypothetical protein
MSNLYVIKAPDMHIAWKSINLAMTDPNVGYNKFAVDHFLNLFDTMMVSSSHRCPVITLEQLAYSPKKANHLLRSYLDPGEIDKWLMKLVDTYVKIGHIDSDIILQTKRESKHGNGPCLLGFSFRTRGEDGPTLSAFSRAAELPQKFGADILLASALGQIICDRLGFETIRVTWFIASSHIKSRMANMFRLFYYPEENITYGNEEFQKHVEKGWQKFFVDQHPVTYVKLVKLQELYNQKVGISPPPGTSTDADGFKQFIIDYMERGS